MQNTKKNGKIVGNVKKVRRLLSMWIYKAINNISPELLQKAFKETGISLALDQSEEHLCKVNIKPFEKFYRSDK